MFYQMIANARDLWLAKFDWINYHPFYHVYMGLKNAYFGTAISPVYYAGAVGTIVLLFLAVRLAFHREIGKEGWRRWEYDIQPLGVIAAWIYLTVSAKGDYHPYRPRSFLCRHGKDYIKSFPL